MARKGDDFAPIANARIEVGDKVGGDYRFRELRFTEEADGDRVEIRDSHPGFLVDGRKVDLRPPSGCVPYAIPRRCETGTAGRYRKTPSWPSAGKPLELRCHLADRGASCDGAPVTRPASVGGRREMEMRPVPRVQYLAAGQRARGAARAPPRPTAMPGRSGGAIQLLPRRTAAPQSIPAKVHSAQTFIIHPCGRANIHRRAVTIAGKEHSCRA